MLKTFLYALLSGLLFAAGLVVSGMVLPAKVLAFLDVASIARGISWQAQPGRWDPSLALVMAGAVGVTLPAFTWARRRTRPWAANQFEAPARRAVDAPLLVGAALFGIGWGLSGYCPGPALASLGLLGTAGVSTFNTIIFVAACAVGMSAARLFIKKSSA
jgi:uncharacterized protein